MRLSRIVFLVTLNLITLASSPAALVTGRAYPFKLLDVDGRTLSNSDGQITVLVLTSRPDVDKSKLVGDRMPQRCLGNSKYRMITVIRFDPTQNRTMRYVSTALVRHGLNKEAKRLKPRYVAKKLTQDPRGDLYAVADFDDGTAMQLGLHNDPAQFRVLIFSARGVLLREWTDVPSEEDLAAAIP